MLVAALILVSIGFAVTLGILLFGSHQAAVPTPSAKKEMDDGAKARARTESELERKQKELDEHRSQLQDLKEQLKQAKRKLFDQKETEKGDRDLVKARAESERQASVQLEVVRGELPRPSPRSSGCAASRAGGLARAALRRLRWHPALRWRPAPRALRPPSPRPPALRPRGRSPLRPRRVSAW